VLVLLVAAAAAVVFFMWPKQGSLVVTVSGPGNVAVDDVKVTVDDAERCQASPCKIEGLAAGVHIVKVVAKGYPPLAGRAITVASGQDAVMDVTVGSSGGGTGLRVGALGSYLRLQVDGEDKGALPLEVTTIEPGPHRIRITGNERFAPFEEQVTIQAGQVLEYQPKLKVLRGRAKLEAGSGADGAHVVLDCTGEDRLLVQLPTSVDISAEKPCTLIATKAGFRDYRQTLVFDEGKAEKTFTVKLDRAEGADVSEGPAGKALGGNGTIMINSVPPSTVVVNGRPLGMTPTSTQVPPGNYNVMFVHPQHGRKSVSVRVTPGGKAVASVTFP
jgi:serine/threonine-protein kinase